MQAFTIDTGVQEFTLNGRGPLRFNPNDPNLYHRFFAVQQTLTDLDEELHAALQALEQAPDKTERDRAAETLALLADYDGRIKALLGDIFGPGNDFGALLEGVSLMAPAGEGRVLDNLLNALAGILQQAMQHTVQARADAAVQQAEAARAARGGNGQPA